MVSISLYRGNLHRVEDVPRTWVLPRPNMTMKEFRSLLNRRNKALARLKSRNESAFPSTPHTTSNGNLPPPPPPLPPVPQPPALLKIPEDHAGKGKDVSVEEITTVVSPDMVVEKDSYVAQGEGGGVDTDEMQVAKDVGSKDEEQEKENDELYHEDSHKSGIPNEKEKRKKEVEEKLEILTKKKHNLVQALKQILSAEEELKKKSSVQTKRPSVSLQVDVSNDSGSITRGATPRTASEANVGGKAGGGGEADDVMNHDLQSRHIPRMSSISPSAESVLKRPYPFQHNAASSAFRSSPSNFAFPGNQGQPPKLPPVSASGTSYAASLSSPAASVGTSSFKDARSASS